MDALQEGQTLVVGIDAAEELEHSVLRLLRQGSQILVQLLEAFPHDLAVDGALLRVAFVQQIQDGVRQTLAGIGVIGCQIGFQIVGVFAHGVFLLSIPNWDMRIIPLWYSLVKEGCAILRLKELREKRHMSQVFLGMELGMSQNTISRYETGAREPSREELIAIADYFDVSVDFLLGRTDNPKVNR